MTHLFIFSVETLLFELIEGEKNNFALVLTEKALTLLWKWQIHLQCDRTESCFFSRDQFASQHHGQYHAFSEHRSRPEMVGRDHCLLEMRLKSVDQHFLAADHHVFSTVPCNLTTNPLREAFGSPFQHQSSQSRWRPPAASVSLSVRVSTGKVHQNRPPFLRRRFASYVANFLMNEQSIICKLVMIEKTNNNRNSTLWTIDQMNSKRTETNPNKSRPASFTHDEQGNVFCPSWTEATTHKWTASLPFSGSTDEKKQKQPHLVCYASTTIRPLYVPRIPPSPS